MLSLGACASCVSQMALCYSIWLPLSWPSLGWPSLQWQSISPAECISVQLLQRHEFDKVVAVCNTVNCFVFAVANCGPCPAGCIPLWRMSKSLRLTKPLVLGA